MWSEVFTHDYENGEKVAILVVDTQGIFDNQSDLRDCTNIFAFSMLFSSIQCYNVLNNVQEDDLNHLELFTEIGRTTIQRSNQVPFQKLLFLVRDWPSPEEIPYGLEGGQIYVDNQILAENDEQTSDMRRLRRRIRASFEKIQAFLMPHPGLKVSQGGRFTGALSDISEDFREYAKQLVTDVVAPSNLIVKKINGHKIRARDLVTYLQVYVNTLNSTNLLNANSILEATAQANNEINYADSLEYYVESMQRLFDGVETYLKQNELEDVHAKTKSEAVNKVCVRCNWIVPVLSLCSNGIFLP